MTYLCRLAWLCPPSFKIWNIFTVENILLVLISQPVVIVLALSSNSPNGNSQLWRAAVLVVVVVVWWWWGSLGAQSPGYWDYKYRVLYGPVFWTIVFIKLMSSSPAKLNVSLGNLIFFAVIIWVGIDYKVWLQGMVKLKTVHQSRLFYRVENHLAQLVTKSHLNRNRMNLPSCQD